MSTSGSSSPPHVEEDFALLAKLLQWPAPQRFPGLDIARLLALNGAAGARLAAQAGTVTEASPGWCVAHALSSPHC